MEISSVQILLVPTVYFFIVKKNDKNSSSALRSEVSANSVAASTSSSLVVPRKRVSVVVLEDLNCRLLYQNQPVLMALYKNSTLAEIDSICVTLPSGVSDVRFSLDGTGPATTLATIRYTWPQVMFEVMQSNQNFSAHLRSSSRVCFVFSKK